MTAWSSSSRPTTARCCCSNSSGSSSCPIALESDGIDVDAIEAALKDGPIKLAHIIPNFHNPAGCTLSAGKRARLVELAAEHDFMIFEDDPYRELPFGESPPPTMLSIDDSDRVIHASSFSKTVSPGVRVGYLAGPAAVIADMAEMANENYISPNMLAGSIVLELCESGALDRNIEEVKVHLHERRDALISALGEHLPSARFVVPAGGYFLWADLGEGFDTVESGEEGQGGRCAVHPRNRLHAEGRRDQPALLLRVGPTAVHRRRHHPHRLGRLSAVSGRSGLRRGRAGRAAPRAAAVPGRRAR